MDETTLRLLCVLIKCWMKRGQQKRVAAPGPAQWHHLFGAYNWRTDEVITLPVAKKNSASFSSFIQLLMATAPQDRPVVLVMDNASYHHSQASEALLAFFETRSTVFWLPPYCSDLNPIERYWRHLKEKACANRLFKTIDEMIDSVDKVLTIQNEIAHSDRFLFTKTFC
ncbi:MAG: IS630 family transposase [Anaerolineaceae bacterium]|nr:IS630 family transposase [Anaerolineaceae bacterium]